MTQEQSVQLRTTAKLCKTLASEFLKSGIPIPYKTIVYLEESARMLKLARYWALKAMGTEKNPVL